MNATNRGRIDQVSQERRYGWIRDRRQRRVFFHASCLAPDVEFEEIELGAVVVFEEVNAPRGPRAVNVQFAAHAEEGGSL